MKYLININMNLFNHEKYKSNTYILIILYTCMYKFKIEIKID